MAFPHRSMLFYPLETSVVIEHGKSIFFDGWASGDDGNWVLDAEVTKRRLWNYSEDTAMGRVDLCGTEQVGSALSCLRTTGAIVLPPGMQEPFCCCSVLN